jgi:hypothetical protein
VLLPHALDAAEDAANAFERAVCERLDLMQEAEQPPRGRDEHCEQREGKA